MRRRLLSLCLVLCMVLGMMPIGVSAAENGDITITAGGESIPAEYLGQCGEKTLGAAYDCFVAEVPAGTDLTVANSAAESGSYSRKNYSGSLCVSFKENPAILEADEVQEYVLTDEEKAALDGDPISFKEDAWALLILQDEETGNVQYVFLKMVEAETFAVTLTEGETYTIAATQDSVSPVVSGGSFSFTVYPVQGYSMDNAVVKANDTVLTPEEDVYTISDITEDIVVTVEGVEKTIENQKTVTVPTGAEVHVYYQQGYSNGNGNDKEIEPVKTVSNGDTVTYYYSVDSAGGTYTAFYEDKIPYAGYFNSVDDVTLSWEGETRMASFRGTYDTSTTFGARGEDSVFTNVNSNGHLVLNEEFMLRAYRGWQIINSDTMNVMIEPEFNYTASNGNITITPYNERVESTTTASGTSSNNWVYLMPSGSGVTYLEIGYDAVHIVDGYEAGAGGGASAQPSNFTWNASDPDRTALIVVQTDGNAASGITFGIRSPSGGWDYEYDTVYFTEDRGSITMQPTGDVAAVSVSHDKGNSYTTLTGNAGIYTVPIVDGNNIIRITDSSGRTAFQVVRGAQIRYSVTNLTTGGDTVSVGDTVRIEFDGMHTVCPKISGIYNPGYPSANKLQYKSGGTTISQSEGYQYDFHNNVWIDVTADNADIVLTDGIMTTPRSYGSAIGGLYQAAAVNSSGTGSDGRNILPEITIPVEGTQTIPSEAVDISEESLSLGIGGTAQLSITVSPEDSTDTLMLVSSDETVATVAGNGLVTAVAAGSTIITATAGSFSDTCTVTVSDKQAGKIQLITETKAYDEVYLSTFELGTIEITGAVPVGEVSGGYGPEWTVDVEADSGETLTITMEGVLGMTGAASSMYFWYNGAPITEKTLADCDNYCYTMTVQPEWVDGTANLTLGVGTSAKLRSETYTITLNRVESTEEFAVTLTEGEGYTIAPTDGSTSPVAAGGSYSFTVTVSDGYEGTPVVKAGETELTAVEGVYTIYNITADQTVTVEGITRQEEPSVPYGDLNGDAEIDVFDAQIAYSIANGMTEATQEQRECCDVDGNGEVDVFDAAIIYSYANGKRDSFPVEGK